MQTRNQQTKRRTQKKSHSSRQRQPETVKPTEVPFLSHIHELRSRLMWVAVSIVGFSIVGYILQDRLIDWLLKPAANQQFIYTTPGGGLNFVLQIVFYFGIVMSIPVLVYNLFRFVEPLLKRRDNGFIIKLTFFSVALAVSGIAFGYYVGLPAAMHFLSGTLKNHEDIAALLTLAEYLSFVTVYLAGSAAMFQLPVVVIFINRVKPLSTRKLLKGETWVIVGAYIVAAIITPTPDVFNQSIIAIPIILVYQLGVLLVWFQNRYSNHIKVHRLLIDDEKRQQERHTMQHQLAVSADPLEPAALPNIVVPELPENFLGQPKQQSEPAIAAATASGTSTLPQSRLDPIRRPQRTIGG